MKKPSGRPQSTRIGWRKPAVKVAQAQQACSNERETAAQARRDVGLPPLCPSVQASERVAALAHPQVHITPWRVVAFPQHSVGTTCRGSLASVSPHVEDHNASRSLAGILHSAFSSSAFNRGRSAVQINYSTLCWTCCCERTKEHCGG